MGEYDTADRQDIVPRFTVRLSVEEDRKLTRLAKEKGLSKNNLIKAFINRAK